MWHDRALLHFFTTKQDQQRYLNALSRSTVPGSIAVIGTFAPDGPRECSGLTVARYDSTQLSTLFGHGWQLLDDLVEQHHTPAGGT
ncbi:MAG: hypothetical protein ACTHMS_10290 [Jatrophihabitans sp.]|uniref:hypothetical protein n=1 Tax=Jatrophihabitans sp. TaxID=1932789 RepID=UPI003F80DA24